MSDTRTAMSLDDLARDIERHAEQADECVIAATMLLREARVRVEAGEAGDIKWYAWAEKNIKLSQSRLRDLLRIAEADDPRKELERQRRLLRERVEKHRGKEAAGWRQDEERVELIALAKKAPIEKVRLALRQIGGQAGTAKSVSNDTAPSTERSQAA